MMSKLNLYKTKTCLMPCLPSISDIVLAFKSDLSNVQIGGRLHRNVHKSHRPRRPKGGFSLVVTPTRGEKYVAKPDGKIRGLNEEEKVLQEHQKIRPRRRAWA